MEQPILTDLKDVTSERYGLILQIAQVHTYLYIRSVFHKLNMFYYYYFIVPILHNMVIFIIDLAVVTT